MCTTFSFFLFQQTAVFLLILFSFIFLTIKRKNKKSTIYENAFQHFDSLFFSTFHALWAPFGRTVKCENFFGGAEILHIPAPFRKKQLFDPGVFIFYRHFSTGFRTGCHQLFITLPTILSAISRYHFSTRGSMPAAGRPSSLPSMIDCTMGTSPRKSTPCSSAKRRAPPRPKR